MSISSVAVNSAFTWAPICQMDAFVHIKSRLSPHCLLRNFFIFVVSILTNDLLTQQFAQMRNWGIFPNYSVMSRLPTSSLSLLSFLSLLLVINCCIFPSWTVFSLTLVVLSFLVSLHILVGEISLYCEFWPCYLSQPASSTVLKILCDSPLLFFPIN